VTPFISPSMEESGVGDPTLLLHKYVHVTSQTYIVVVFYN